MTKARLPIFALAMLGLFGGAYLHDLHATDAELDTLRRAQAAACEAWAHPSARAASEAGTPGDARAALHEVFRRADLNGVLRQALVQSGAPLSPDVQRALAAAAPSVAAARAALRLASHGRSPQACDPDADDLSIRAIKVHTAMALTGERALAQGERSEGSDAMVDALAFALELRSWGTPFTAAMSAGLASTSCAQLSRRWDDLAPSARARIAELAWAPLADAAEGARLRHAATVLRARSPGWLPALVRDARVVDELSASRPTYDLLRVAYEDASPSTSECRALLRTDDEELDYACRALDRVAEAGRAVRALAARARTGR
jgi:hypothetical protein